MSTYHHSEAHLEVKLANAAQAAYHRAFLPFVQFVKTVYEQVRHNLSEPVPSTELETVDKTLSEAGQERCVRIIILPSLGGRSN